MVGLVSDLGDICWRKKTELSSAFNGIRVIKLCYILQIPTVGQFNTFLQ